jgi:type II restriction enzyme
MERERKAGMADKDFISRKKGKGQSDRLSAHHIKAGGPAGTFGVDAQSHDAAVGAVAKTILLALKQEFPNLTFRFRLSIKKQEIHENLNRIDNRLGVKLFVPTASIRPDGGVIEVLDNGGSWRVILVGESKHQGNDVSNIKGGIRTVAMEKKQQYIMPAGNAIERVHKNIQEMKNFMLGEKHFPYVVFLQGSNFATEPFLAEWPDGTEIPILPSDSSVNRIDRVTAANYGMEINRDYCKNVVTQDGRQLQVASIYAQCELFDAKRMFEVLWNTAVTSLELLADELPEAVAE